MIDIELTQGGSRYQLLLFNRLADVQRFNTIPSTAFHVYGKGGGGDLKLVKLGDGESVYAHETGLPERFRDYRYFGIARAVGSSRTLVLYDAIARLGKRPWP